MGKMWCCAVALVLGASLLCSAGAQQTPPKKQSPSNEGTKAEKAPQTPPQEKQAAQEPAGQTASEKKKEEEKAPDFLDDPWKWVRYKFGLPGLLGAALLVLVGFTVWNWKRVRAIPGVGPLLLRLVPIPKADPSKYSVAVALFENDPKGENHELVRAGLSTAALTTFQGIQVLNLERVISPRGADASAAEQAGHAKAREYLRKLGAQALIWGEVLTSGKESVPRLFWTVVQEDAAVSAAGRHVPLKECELPQIFWWDLNDVLLLLAATQAAEFEAQSGQFVADRLKPFIEKTRKLVNRSRGSAELNVEQRTKLLVLFARSLTTFGEQAGDSKALEEAIAAYRETLRQYTRDKVPLAWATTQNNLGTALARLGERQSGTARLEEAVAAFRAALKERTREKVPLDWAATQTRLGAALAILGQRESGTGQLEDAVAAFREALKERTRGKVPLDWAMTQNNLGAALRALGERESGTKRLEESVAAYREALKECKREKVPLDWAMTQNNLGNALSSLGERESGTARLEEAVATYREALKEYTREKVPLDWAMTQNNLGNALAQLGEREAGTARLEEAVAAYREGLKERRQEEVPLDWAMTQNNLGNALTSLGKREAGTARLEEAVAAYREALKERTQEKVPLKWAMTTENLGLALGVLAIRQGDAAGYCASIVERLRALEEYRKAGAEYYEKKAASFIARAIEQMKATFGEETFEACRAKHAGLFGTLR
jgi:tetratricopeptide (TPR) repeat protein